ncbi:TetR family transcriptional regulator [Winogradskya consettensis]|uniref:TetR family regulatory protein n=1 Tax=Winogradskya consettensis TaxID=113560 RepID=A0A919VZ92_9ACTN|nr:TetR family transcriptional regulator [Actinoplanes consettensis]GIM81408.1 putative TetR family regulatory protein [Actinoplanes consettensis]
MSDDQPLPTNDQPSLSDGKRLLSSDRSLLTTDRSLLSGGKPRQRDAAATKARLLQAATDEFATHGIAGARIDRIAAAAKANKALVYAYFGNKEALFEAVLDTHVGRLLAEVPFTADDLPGYAGRLFDYLLAHPHQLRLATWHRLEEGADKRNPAELNDSLEHNAGLIATAQDRGTLPTTFTPADLLVFTLALSSAWMPGSPTAMPRAALDIHRAAVVEAVRRLVTK